MGLNNLTLQDREIFDIALLFALEYHVYSAGLIVREELTRGWVDFEQFHRLSHHWIRGIKRKPEEVGVFKWINVIYDGNLLWT